MSRLSRVYVLLGLALIFGSGVLLWLWQTQTPLLEMKNLKGDVARGAYLARMSGCIACHTDMESGGAPLAGGKAIHTPFGEFRAPNLTTDEEHGIGAWSIQQFSAAVREGISPEGKPYYPAFPYTFYNKFSDQDIVDLWAAFKTVPAVSEPDPKQAIKFPFNIREGLNFWRALFFDYGASNEPLKRDNTYEQGRYIVEVAAHCGACHTPRNLLGALQFDQAFTGGIDASGNSVPNITAQKLESSGWSEDDLAYALQTGIKPDGDVFGGSMSEIVEHGTAYLSWDDLRSIANYLLTKSEDK
jgi:mono/diheme cytochrome c family protein